MLELARQARQGCWCETTRKPCQYHEGFLDAIDAVLQLRLRTFSVGNDKVWGEGNWVECEQCPDAMGAPSFHHKDFHQ